jgi:hypothetical protein
MIIALQLTGLLLVALVVSVYWGPWVALTRRIARLDLEVFLPVVKQLNANLSGLMTVLVPVALLGQIGLLIVDHDRGPLQFTLSAAAFLLFVVTVVVTVLTEVPIVKQIVTWQVETVPQNWRELRDRWASFHLLRVIPGLVALALYLVAAIL